jgi:mannitol/fructose-specific phosphotransferase system IIA component (Ntr-type)
MKYETSLLLSGAKGLYMVLRDIFNEESIKIRLEGRDKEAVFSELIAVIKAAHPEMDEDEMRGALQEREKKMSTGIASGIAVPHGYYRGINTIVGALGISEAGIDYGTADKKPVYVVCMLIMGESVKEYHLRVLNQVFTLLKSEAFSLLRSAKTAKEVFDIIRGGQLKEEL